MPALLVLFQFQSLPVDILVQLLKKITLRKITFSHQKFLKNDPLSLDPSNIDKNDPLSLDPSNIDKNDPLSLEHMILIKQSDS